MPPKAWLERTDVLEPLQSVFDAFWDLSPGREIHMGGEGYISAREVEAYCNLAGVNDSEDRLAVFRLIRAMDGAYLTERERLRDAEAKKPKG